VQEEKDKINDLKKHIKDLEMELEFLYVREPNSVRYISDLENKVDQLYEELDSIIDNE
jgi:predicted enzyme involved in methoxymalonyl-ACP biosynthesis